MPSYRTAFPSKYLKAEDLGTSRPIVTIATIDFEMVGPGQDQARKLVAHFEEPIKPLVLNLINSATIAEVVGSDDYESWLGHRIQLYAAKTEFQGKRVPCIRVCAPPAKPIGRAVPRPAAPPNDPASDQDVESEVGF